MTEWLRSIGNGFLSIFTFGAYPEVTTRKIASGNDLVRRSMSDDAALAADWEAVGDDLRRAIDQFKQEEGLT